MYTLIRVILVLTLASAAGSGAAAAAAAPVGGFGITISGGKLVSTADGSTVQLRGVDVSGLEFVAIGNPDWANRNPWGAQTGDTVPNWRAIRAWNANVVRLTLNEASWLGYNCVDRNGKTINPDPWGNYQATVRQSVADAVAAGLYVIVDLHWSAPGSLCPVSQDQLPDADHSLKFWISVANTFKSNPAVIFDLFNEPRVDSHDSATDWRRLRDGGTFSSFVSDSGHYQLRMSWLAVGMQSLVDTVRATGATNVLMVAGLSDASNLAEWMSYKPDDPLNRIALSWHAYSGIQPRNAAVATAAMAAGIPVIIGETGDKSSNGTASAPIIKEVTAWADQHNASVLAWTWDTWKDSSGNPMTENLLIKDAAGTPTDGEGVAFKAWLAAHR
jgi:hypothetical protein